MKNYLITMLTLCLLMGCLKNDDVVLDYRGIEPLAINPNANFPSKGVFPTPLIDSAFGVTKLNLTAKYSFQMPAPQDIKVSFTRDDATASQYNTTFGTTYLPLPLDCYELPAQAIIPAGSQTVILPVKLFPNKISGTKKYIIAFSLTSADGVKIAENFKTMVFTLKGQ